MKHLLAIALLSVAPALAGPYDQPYSIIETDTMPAADSHLKPVIVNRVDEQNSIDNRAVVAPGAHKVVMDLPPRKGYPATQNTLDLTTEACMRYYVAARLDSLTLQRWEPVVRYSEPIGECRKKFNMTDATR